MFNFTIIPFVLTTVLPCTCPETAPAKMSTLAYGWKIWCDNGVGIMAVCGVITAGVLLWDKARKWLLKRTNKCTPDSNHSADGLPSGTAEAVSGVSVDEDSRSMSVAVWV